MTKHTIAILGALTSAAACHAQTAISSTFSLGVFADADQLDGHTQTAIYNDSQGGTLNPFSHNLSVTDTEATGGSLTTTSSASANWTNAGQGSVAWRDMGWVHHTHTRSGAKLNGFVANGPVWSYTFLAGADGVFDMNYDVRAAGSPFGLLGVTIEWSGPGGNLDLVNPYTPVASGVFSRTLTSGQVYTIGLFNMGNIFTSIDARNDFARMDADFSWNVAVPEPSGIVAVAIGGIMIVRRRRRLARLS